MLEYTVNQRKIEIDLPNGIYNLSNESGTGKTFLCKSLNYIGAHGECVNGYTYENYLRGEKLSSLHNFDRIKCLMIDRYDLYNTEFIDDIIKLGNRCIVLIDIKDLTSVQIPTEDAKVTLFKDRLEVCRDDIFI